MPVHKAHFSPVSDPLSSFTRTYWNLLPLSDYNCIYRLIEQGQIEVVRDTGSRAIALIPSEKVKQFVDEVFAAVTD